MFKPDYSSAFMCSNRNQEDAMAELVRDGLMCES